MSNHALAAHVGLVWFKKLEDDALGGCLKELGVNMFKTYIKLYVCIYLINFVSEDLLVSEKLKARLNCG